MTTTGQVDSDARKKGANGRSNVRQQAKKEANEDRENDSSGERGLTFAQSVKLASLALAQVLVDSRKQSNKTNQLMVLKQQRVITLQKQFAKLVDKLPDSYDDTHRYAPRNRNTCRRIVCYFACFVNRLFVHRYVKKLDELDKELEIANKDLQAFHDKLDAADNGPVSDAARFIDMTMERLMPKNKKAKFQDRIDSVVEMSAITDRAFDGSIYHSPSCEDSPEDSNITEVAKTATPFEHDLPEDSNITEVAETATPFEHEQV